MRHRQAVAAFINHARHNLDQPARLVAQKRRIAELLDQQDILVLRIVQQHADRIAALKHDALNLVAHRTVEAFMPKPRPQDFKDIAKIILFVNSRRLNAHNGCSFDVSKIVLRQACRENGHCPQSIRRERKPFPASL